MDHFHAEFDAGPNDVIEVTLDVEARVCLMNKNNYASCQAGESFRYYGGPTKKSPVRLVPPYQDTWHVVVDLGGAEGTPTASAQLIRDPS